MSDFLASVIEFLLNYIAVPIWWVLRPIFTVVRGAFKHIGNLLSLIVAAVVVVFIVSYFLPINIRSYIGSAIQEYQSGRLWGTSDTSSYYFAAQYRDASSSIESLPAARCWMRSVASNRPDAYRCMTDSGIFDPCFTDPTEDSVLICPSEPHKSYTYYKVDLNTLGKLSQYPYKAATSSSPWYITLSDGTGCNLITGASSLVGDMRMDYYCGENHQPEYLLLPLDKSGDVEKIGCYVGDKIESCPIKEVWY